MFQWCEGSREHGTGDDRSNCLKMSSSKNCKLWWICILCRGYTYVHLKWHTARLTLENSLTCP
jgi:hypothetical protein